MELEITPYKTTHVATAEELQGLPTEYLHYYDELLPMLQLDDAQLISHVTEDIYHDANRNPIPTEGTLSNLDLIIERFLFFTETTLPENYLTGLNARVREFLDSDDGGCFIQFATTATRAFKGGRGWAIQITIFNNNF